MNELGFFKAKTDDEGDFLRILLHQEMTDVTNEDIERMENFYDCSCKVIRKTCGQSYANKRYFFLFSNDGCSYMYTFLKLSPYYMQGLRFLF